MFQRFKKWFGRITQNNKNEITYYGNDTPLHLVIRSFEGDISFVEILLKLDGAGINVRNSEGETPLHLAVKNEKCSPELIMLLLQHGARVRITSPRDGNTALHWLAISCMNSNRRHSHTIGKILLRHGSDINARNLEGCTPLHYAVLSKMCYQPLTVVLLRNDESDVCMRNLNGDTPFHLYLRNQSKFCYTRWFLRKFLDVNVVNSKGETLLHSAVRNKSCSLLVIIFLLNRGADVSIRDVLGENAYQAYCRAAEEDNRKADPTLQMLLQGYEYVNSSLHVACLFHDVDSVHRLLRLGVDVNAVDTFGYPPLFYAFVASGDNENATEKRSGTLRLLLDFGADIYHPIESSDIVDSASDSRISRLLSSILRVMPREWQFIYYIYQAEPSDDCLLKILFQRLAKLSTLQERLNERGIDLELLSQSDRRHLDALQSLVDSEEYNKDWISRCSEELQTMSGTELGKNTVTFFDLLVASAKETAMYAKNKELLKVFHAKKAKFPMYQGMLEAKLARDLERRELIESAAVSMCNALEFADPSDEFYERTLSYCSNQDLISLIG